MSLLPEHDPEQSPVPYDTGRSRGEREADQAAPAGAAGASPETAPVVAPAQPAGGFPPELPEDLRVGWTWLDLLIVIFIGIGALILATQAAAIIVVIATNLPPVKLEKLPNARTAFAALQTTLFAFLVFSYLFAMVRIRLGTPFWTTLGFRRFSLRGATLPVSCGAYLILGMAMAVAAQIASAPVRTREKLPIQEFFQTPESIGMMAAVALLVAPVFEEAVLRGFFYPVLARGWGIPAAVGVTGLSFGLLHVRQLWGGWGEIASLAAVGIILSGVRARTRSVLPCFLLHFGYNFMVLLQAYVLTDGFRNLPHG